MFFLRFVAEELKSWNLLTRTGQNFEFINWRKPTTIFFKLKFFNNNDNSLFYVMHHLILNRFLYDYLLFCSVSELHKIMRIQIQLSESKGQNINNNQTQSYELYPDPDSCLNITVYFVLIETVVGY